MKFSAAVYLLLSCRLAFAGSVIHESKAAAGTVRIGPNDVPALGASGPAASESSERLMQPGSGELYGVGPEQTLVDLDRVELDPAIKPLADSLSSEAEPDPTALIDGPARTSGKTESAFADRPHAGSPDADAMAAAPAGLKRSLGRMQDAVRPRGVGNEPFKVLYARLAALIDGNGSHASKPADSWAPFLNKNADDYSIRWKEFRDGSVLVRAGGGGFNVESNLGHLKRVLNSVFPELAAAASNHLGPDEFLLPPLPRFRAVTRSLTGLEFVYTQDPPAEHLSPDLESPDFMRLLSEGKWPMLDFHDLYRHWWILIEKGARAWDFKDIAGTTMRILWFMRSLGDRFADIIWNFDDRIDRHLHDFGAVEKGGHARPDIEFTADGAEELFISMVEMSGRFLNQRLTGEPELKNRLIQELKGMKRFGRALAHQLIAPGQPASWNNVLAINESYRPVEPLPDGSILVSFAYVFDPTAWRDVLNANFPAYSQLDEEVGHIHHGVRYRLPPFAEFFLVTLEKTGLKFLLPITNDAHRVLLNEEFLQFLADGARPIYDFGDDLRNHWKDLMRKRVDGPMLTDIAATTSGFKQALRSWPVGNNAYRAASEFEEPIRRALHQFGSDAEMLIGGEFFAEDPEQLFDACVRVGADSLVVYIRERHFDAATVRLMIEWFDQQGNFGRAIARELRETAIRHWPEALSA